MSKTIKKLLFAFIFVAMLLPVHTQPKANEPEFIVTAGQQTPIEVEVWEPSIPESDIRLLALLTMAEAEGECEMGKRLVIDTVLNRVDAPYWSDTVEGVIYQKGQFTSMWNGRADRCYVRDDIYQLVLEELESRTNSDCVYFRAGHYSAYGTPMFRVENHYFSSL